MSINFISRHCFLFYHSRFLDLLPDLRSLTGFSPSGCFSKQRSGCRLLWRFHLNLDWRQSLHQHQNGHTTHVRNSSCFARNSPPIQLCPNRLPTRLVVICERRQLSFTLPAGTGTNLTLVVNVQGQMSATNLIQYQSSLAFLCLCTQQLFLLELPAAELLPRTLSLLHASPVIVGNRAVVALSSTLNAVRVHFQGQNLGSDWTKLSVV